MSLSFSASSLILSIRTWSICAFKLSLGFSTVEPSGLNLTFGGAISTGEEVDDSAPLFLPDGERIALAFDPFFLSFRYFWYTSSGGISGLVD